MKIVLANLASPANPGDQAILRGTLKLLREIYPQPEITVVTRAYSQKQTYEVLGCRVVAHYPDVECLATDSRLKKILNLPKALLKPGPLRRAIRDCDQVYLIGGHYFYSYKAWMPGFTYLSHFSAVAWACFYKKPVLFLPQSYGPFCSWISRVLFDWAVKRSRFIFFREPISGDWLRQRYPAQASKMGYLPDLALYLKKEDLLTVAIEKKDSEKIIGVTIRAWKGKETDQNSYLAVLRECFNHLRKKYGNLRIRVIAQVQDAKKGEGDEWISEELVQQLNRDAGWDFAELYTKAPFFSLPEICRLYHECHGLIGMRLHSGLLSFMVGTPALVAGYQHKAEGILKALKLGELYLGSFDGLGGANLLKATEDLLESREKWKRVIDNALTAARSEILKNFQTTLKQQRL